MKRIKVGFLAVVVTAAFLAISCTSQTTTPDEPTQVEPRVLRFTTGTLSTDMAAEAIQMWAADVTEKTQGRYEIEFIFGGSLAKIDETLEAVQSGLADLGHLACIFYPSRLPLSLFTYAVPFNPPDTRVLNEVLDVVEEQVPEIDAELAKENLISFYRMALADYNLQTIKPVQTLADLKGLKIACVGATLPKWLAAVDAVPVAMGVMDRYSALQTGLIEASIMSLNWMEPYNYTDFCKYVTYVNLGTAFSVREVFNLDVWNSFSSADQKIMMDAGLKVQKWIDEETMKAEADLVPRWEKEYGVTFYQLSDTDKATWAELLKYEPYDWCAEWDAQGVPATKTIEAYFQACEQVGYEFPTEFVKR